MSPKGKQLTKREYEAMPDFEKVKFLEEMVKARNLDISEADASVLSYREKLDDALQDSYEAQTKATQAEQQVWDLKAEMDRYKNELPREVQRLKAQLKRRDGETRKLEAAVANKEAAIERIRETARRQKEDSTAEITGLDEMIDQRNREVDQLQDNNAALKERVQTLERHVDIEKRTAEKYKDAADKFDEAGPALERLNKILAKYLGDQLQDGLDWPPGHPNSKSSINKALDALDNELRKASLKPSISVPATPTTASKPQSQQNDKGVGADITFKAPAYNTRRRSDTTTSRNSIPPNTVRDLAAEVQEALRGATSDDEDDTSFTRSSSESTRTPSRRDSDLIVNEKKGLSGTFKSAMTSAVKNLGIEMGLKNDSVSPTSVPNPYDLLKTPTNDKSKRPALGLPTNSDMGNAGKRNSSLFGNNLAPADDDSPKPSNNVFGDDKRPKSSRFAPRPVPVPEPIIEYRDKLVYIDLPVPVPCSKAHVEDQKPLKPEMVIRELMCGKMHVEDQEPVKPEVVVEEVKVMVPCSRDDVDEKHVCKREIEYRDREVPVPPVPCRRAHVEDQAPVSPKIKEVKVMVPCSRDHLSDHTCAKGIQYVDKPVDKFIDRPVIQEKIIDKYITRIVYTPRHPLLTVFHIYADLWICLIYFLNTYSTYTRGILDTFSSYLPARAHEWFVTSPLIGQTYEVIDRADAYPSLQNAKVAMLKLADARVLETDTTVQNLKAHYLAEKETKAMSSLPPATDPVPSAFTSTSTSTSNPPPPPSNPKAPYATAHPPSITPTPTTTRSTLTSHGYEAEYLLATQYTIRRPPFLPNLLLSILITLSLPILIFALVVVREYSSLLEFNGVVMPHWFMLPTQGPGYEGYGYGDGSGYGAGMAGNGWVVDRDWSWGVYIWKGIFELGWWRQVNFWLAMKASGGAGYRMPG